MNQIGIGRYYVPRSQTLPTSNKFTFLPSVAREYKKVHLFVIILFGITEVLGIMSILLKHLEHISLGKYKYQLIVANPEEIIQFFRYQ